MLNAPSPEPAIVARGMHAHIRASHDRKIVSAAQIEATRQRRLQEATAKRADNSNKFTSQTDSTPKTRSRREAVYDPKVGVLFSFVLFDLVFCFFFNNIFSI